ncbi:MAG: hypothetical protein WCG92_23145 [Hyphomicrobiales bacterium]
MFVSSGRRRVFQIEWIGYIAWAAMFCVVLGRTLAGKVPSVTPVYRFASESLMQSQSFYPDLGAAGPVM